MKKNPYFFWKGTFIGIILLLSFGPAVFSDTLKIHYYNNFNEFAHLNSKYSQPDKYLVYKYASFTTDGTVHYTDVSLTFDVDKNWYKKNKIEDIIFLQYVNGSWTRINYNTKTESSGHVHYRLNSNELGDYWAIIGVLPNDKNIISNDILIKNKTQLKQINQSGTSFLDETSDNQKIDKFIKDSKQAIITLKEPAKVKGASIAATTTATLSIATLIALLNGPANFLIVFKQLVLALVGLFSTKKKLRGGIVYDVNTGRPISLVRVDIIDKTTNKVKTTKFTNKEGRYYFLAPKGDYIIKAKKPKYKIVDIDKINFVKALLHKEDLLKEVRLDKPGVIKKNIALLRSDDAMYSRNAFFNIIKNILNYITKILFILGLVFNIWVCYVHPNFLNFSMLGVYVLVILFRWMFISREKYGTITDKNNKPEAFATINIFDYNNNRLVSRAVTDTKGRYYITLDKGTYLLEIKTNDGITIKKKIKVLNKNTLSKKIVIKLVPK